MIYSSSRHDQLTSLRVLYNIGKILIIIPPDTGSDIVTFKIFVPELRHIFLFMFEIGKKFEVYMTVII
jgi:hypothetical protein